uniref:Uncharacterized protein n=1 Tax=Hyaloperonospora arabidopsidis (strain Emoy2) TaxID=559515 RepID=M4BWG8_HYAAE
MIDITRVTHCKCFSEEGHSTPKSNSLSHEFGFIGISGIGERERYGGGVADGMREHKEVVVTAIILSCYFRGS